MARVLCLVDDLMLQSKVVETLRSAGHEVVVRDLNLEMFLELMRAERPQALCQRLERLAGLLLLAVRESTAET